MIMILRRIRRILFHNFRLSTLHAHARSFISVTFLQAFHIRLLLHFSSVIPHCT